MGEYYLDTVSFVRDRNDKLVPLPVICISRDGQVTFFGEAISGKELSVAEKSSGRLQMCLSARSLLDSAYRESGMVNG